MHVNCMGDEKVSSPPTLIITVGLGMRLGRHALDRHVRVWLSGVSCREAVFPKSCTKYTQKVNDMTYVSQNTELYAPSARGCENIIFQN